MAIVESFPCFQGHSEPSQTFLVFPTCITRNCSHKRTDFKLDEDKRKPTMEGFGLRHLMVINVFCP